MLDHLEDQSTCSLALPTPPSFSNTSTFISIVTASCMSTFLGTCCKYSSCHTVVFLSWYILHFECKPSPHLKSTHQTSQSRILLWVNMMPHGQLITSRLHNTISAILNSVDDILLLLLLFLTFERSAVMGANLTNDRDVALFIIWKSMHPHQDPSLTFPVWLLPPNTTLTIGALSPCHSFLPDSADHSSFSIFKNCVPCSTCSGSLTSQDNVHIQGHLNFLSVNVQKRLGICVASKLHWAQWIALSAVCRQTLLQRFHSQQRLHNRSQSSSACLSRLQFLSGLYSPHYFLWIWSTSWGSQNR